MTSSEITAYIRPLREAQEAADGSIKYEGKKISAAERKKLMKIAKEEMQKKQDEELAARRAQLKRQ